MSAQSSSFTEGLEGIVAAQSSICTVDGQAGRLIYYGYDIQDLAANSTFEEVTYLLWFGDLPSSIPARPVHRGAFSREDAADPGGRAPPKYAFYCQQNGRPADDGLGPRPVRSRGERFLARGERPKGPYRLTGEIATLVAGLHRIQQGLEPVQSNPRLSHAADFLQMLTGEEPRPEYARIFDVALILHADHELNASTFAARVTAATLSDFYSAITSAIGTLKGPLHGGANEAVMRMLLKIERPENVEPYIAAELNAKRRIPGRASRCIGPGYPRALVLQDLVCDFEVSAGGVGKWCQLAQLVAETVFTAKRLYPNVDFYSAPLYYTLGIPIELYAPAFRGESDQRLGCTRPRAVRPQPADSPSCRVHRPGERGSIYRSIDAIRLGCPQGL